MYKLYLDANESQNHVSYETYRTIFNTEFNISFGYPRTDTSSACDEFTMKAKALRAEGNIIEFWTICTIKRLKRFMIVKRMQESRAKQMWKFKQLPWTTKKMCCYQTSPSMMSITNINYQCTLLIFMHSFWCELLFLHLSRNLWT